MPNDIAHIKPTVNRLIDMIVEGGIKIPPLQRPFVWKVNQIIELLESIHSDFPIGSILCWETSDVLPSERNIAGFKLPDKPESHPFYYVLDGQQRLSSLYGVFCTDRTVDDGDEEFSVDHKIFDIFFDLNENNFVHESERKPGNQHLAMKGLFDPEIYANAITGATNDDERKKIMNLYTTFTNYEVPVLVTKKRELEEVGSIFERVNNTGTKLDLFDLMVALTWTKEFHLQNEFKILHEILDKKHFKGLKNKILLQCISGISKESCRTKVITKLEGKDVRSSIKILIESLEKSTDFLVTQLKVGSRDVLPHAHQIIPLCYFFSKVTTPTTNQLNAIKRWFWKTSFSDRYSSGTDKSVDEDIALFKNLIADDDPNSFDKLKYTVSAEQLRNTKFLKSNPFSRAFVVLLANKIPLNLTNGGTIDIGEALSSFSRKEYHHVFPDAFLKSKDEPTENISSICNFCLLPSDSNKTISDKSPSEYFSKIIPKNKHNTILESNLLPAGMELYQNNDYENFLIERSKKIIEFINKQLD